MALIHSSSDLLKGRVRGVVRSKILGSDSMNRRVQMIVMPGHYCGSIIIIGWTIATSNQWLECVEALTNWWDRHSQSHVAFRALYHQNPLSGALTVDLWRVETVVSDKLLFISCSFNYLSLNSFWFYFFNLTLILHQFFLQFEFLMSVTKITKIPFWQNGAALLPTYCQVGQFWVFRP